MNFPVSRQWDYAREIACHMTLPKNKNQKVYLSAIADCRDIIFLYNHIPVRAIQKIVAME